MDTEIVNKSNFELFIQLVDTIIWPVTLLFVLFLFRRNLSEIIQRLGSVKADGTGIKISFEDKIASTKKLFQQIKPATVSKSSQEIQPEGLTRESPFGQISGIKTNLINYLKSKAEEDNIHTEGLSATMTCDKLKETGAITIQKAKMIAAMLDVIAAAKPSATQEQADEIESLYNKIGIH
jgi:hypothetical protein